MSDIETFTASLPDAAQAYLEHRRLDEVECIIADLPGIARGKAVPASKFARQKHFHLPDSIFYQTVTGGWGEAAGEEGFIERDMILRPDLSTASAAPWTADWTIQVIHDAFDREGAPIAFSPRNVLRRWSRCITRAASSRWSRPRWNSSSWRAISTPPRRSSR